MSKVAILGLYATALYFVLKRYYQNGHSGIPNPQAIVAPTYLYTIFALASGFFGPGIIFLAAGLTVAMIWDVQKNPTSTVPNPQTTPQGTRPITSVNPTLNPSTYGPPAPGSTSANPSGIGGSVGSINPKAKTTFA